MNGMTVCSGIGAPEIAAPFIDWRYQAEIEKFPSAVLAARFPHAKNLGDMTKFKEWPHATINVLVGGTPCQSFSVAGLRKGMADPRGNLALTYLAIADRYRPTWLVWENVPGVLSSNGGRDFGSILGGMAELGYGFAYRILDAQFVRVESHPRAVPQRRRRVFVVGHLGDWRRAAAVLFERESLSGHSPPSRKSGQRITRGIEIGPSGGRFTDVNPTLGTDARNGPRQAQLAGAVLCTETAMCLNAGAMGRQEAESETLIPVVAAQGGTGIIQSMAVRRLTPTECERLQGFPDGHTAITFRGKPAADGPRYKALGNSMAVNCMNWILRRVHEEDTTP